MQVRDLHPWRVGYGQAVELQESLRTHLRRQPIATPVRLVAGMDVAYSRPTHRMYAAVVVLELPSLAVIETVHTVRRARFPYIPGLFTFREAPPLLAALRRLRSRPDVFLCDGQGLAHPRRFGLACHLGLILDRPTVGCAKSRLIGTHHSVKHERGSWTPLVDAGEQVGAALRTQDGVKPVYVSTGHRADLDSAIRLVLGTTTRYRIPEPIRLAHQATAVLRRRLDPRFPVPRVHDYPDFRREHGGERRSGFPPSGLPCRPSGRSTRWSSGRAMPADLRGATMRATDILKRLRSLANRRNVLGMARFGINPKETLGIPIPVLRDLAKQIGTDHALALRLWRSGVHEARILASYIADPDRATQSLIERWGRDLDSWDVCDQVMEYIAKTPFAYQKVDEWAGRSEEFVKRAAFALIAELAVHDKLAPDRKLAGFFGLIAREAWDDRNFVRKAVNWALRNLGKRSRELHRQAIATALTIRKQGTRPARWIAADALRELRSEKVRARLAARDKRRRSAAKRVSGIRSR